MILVFMVALERVRKSPECRHIIKIKAEIFGLFVAVCMGAIQCTGRY